MRRLCPATSKLPERNIGSEPINHLSGKISFGIACALALIIGWQPLLVTEYLAGWTDLVIDQLGVGFLWTGTAMLLTGLTLALTPIGRLRLGQDDGQPEFSRLSWMAMLFATGMGSGLVFWGVAEPLTHYANPPQGSGADNALALTFFHWGLHAWAIYAMAGLVIAYFAFRHRQGFTIAAPLTATLARVVPIQAAQFVGGLATLLAILAVIFGVAGTLANGVILLRSGMVALGLSAGALQVVQFGLLALLSGAFLTSARSGLSRSIRWLSLVNLSLAAGLFAYLFILLEPLDLISRLFTSSAVYLRSLPAWSLQLIETESGHGWAHGWTITYLIWWIAWTPFVGVFIARISRGRTIREYLLAVILVPTIVSVLWFTTFGGGAISFDQANDGLLQSELMVDYTRPLFVWLNQLPLGVVLQLVSVVLLFVFLVTSADSAAYVLGMLGSNGNPEPSNRSKLGWGALTVLIAASLLVRNDVDINKAVAIVGAIPFTVILWLQVLALLLAIFREWRKPSGQISS
nr:glycine betaine transporter BetL-like [Nerophis lumbriciformis]